MLYKYVFSFLKHIFANENLPILLHYKDLKKITFVTYQLIKKTHYT